MKSALLVLEDGTFFPGRAFGRDGEAIGEVAFNTALFGFQELLTDPTSAGRLLLLTANTVGAAGTNPLDMESDRAQATGLIVRNLSRLASNYRSTASFDAFCATQGVVGIADLDTRALTIHLREKGPQMGAVVSAASVEDVPAIVARVRQATPATQVDFRAKVGVQSPTRITLEETGDSYQPQRVVRDSGVTDGGVVVVDLGASESLLKQVANAGFDVTLVPGTSSADAILARKPQAVLVSSGPGNPEVLRDLSNTLRDLVGKVTLVGTGLGCQVLAQSVGGETYKIASPNLGVNIPVRRERDQLCGNVAHHHLYGIRFPKAVEGLRVSYTNVTTGAAEGFDIAAKSVYGVQHIPTDAKLTEALSSVIG